MPATALIEARVKVATSTYSYDLNGNVTQIVQGATTTSYGYDYLNRLATSTITGGQTTAYGYDAFGNRVFQQMGSTTTVYPSKWYSVVTTSAATSTGTSTDYVLLPAQAGENDRLLATVDQPMVNGAPTGSSTLRYVHTDNLGSTAVTSDVNGNLAQWFDYSPYGSVLASTNTGTTTAARQFIGQFADNSGLSYLNARYYEPAQGQFLTEDPIFLSSSQNLRDPQSLNAYSYSEDNPIVSEDPSGRDPYGDYWYGVIARSGYQGEEQDAMDLSNSSPIWSFAIDHPYTTAAIAAAASYPALTVAGSAAAAFGMAAAPGVGTAFAAEQAFAGSVYFTLAAHSALEIPGLIGAFSQGNPGNFSSYFPAALSATEQFGPSAFEDTYPGTIYDAFEFASILNNTLGSSAKNLFSSSVTARTQTAQTFNSAISGSSSGSGGGAPSSNSLWVTPSGAVVNFGGQLVSGPPASE